MKFALLSSLVASTALAAYIAPQQVGNNGVATSTQNEAVSLPFVFPQETYTTSKLPVFASLLRNANSEEENVKIGLSFLSKELSVKPDQLRVTDSYMDDGKVVHVYVVRSVSGADVVNQRAAVHLRNGEVVAFSSSFSDKDKPATENTLPTPPKDLMPMKDAIAKGSAAVKNLPHHTDATVHHQWVENDKGKMVYTYVAQYRNEEGSEWYELFIDAKTGEIVHAVDYVARASYKVLPFPRVSPEDGFEVVSNPAFEASSPLGWHNDGSKTYTTTRGNNIDTTLPNSVRPQSTGDLDFDTAWDATAEPRTEANARASAVNLFYLANVMHDISYQFGFTEAAGNFQNKNKDGKGAGGDPVSLSAQSKQGTNNAYFSTPADGQKPSMVMFLFTSTKPQRDGGLENDVPIHEYTHGISTRMTGGGKSSTCLRSGEAGSMGEGWGDSLAMFLLRKETDTRDVDFTMGSYVINKPKGIRSYPYSTSMTTNPLTYADLKSRGEVHAGGEVWATILNEMYWNLRDKWGYSKNWYDATQPQGNIVAMKLVFGGFANQPCNPSFVQARDAILLSDKLYYNSEHTCEVWRAFAKRGLGTGAVSGKYNNSFDVPAECQARAQRRPR